MFAITGNVGSQVARNLSAARRPVRAVVRDVAKGDAWAQRGFDVAVSDIKDARALTAAFREA
jgi:NAD(P)H dehydrogenase (quinone)